MIRLLLILFVILSTQSCLSYRVSNRKEDNTSYSFEGNFYDSSKYILKRLHRYSDNVVQQLKIDTSFNSFRYNFTLLPKRSVLLGNFQPDYPRLNGNIFILIKQKNNNSDTLFYMIGDKIMVDKSKRDWFSFFRGIRVFK